MSPSSSPPVPPLSLALYAQIVAEYGRGGVELEVILARRGLDSGRWENAERYWQERIDREVESEPDGLAPILGEYAAALQKGQQPLQGATLSFDEFLGILSALTSGQSPADILARAGVTLERYLEAQRYWLQQLGSDASLRARYLTALSTR